MHSLSLTFFAIEYAYQTIIYIHYLSKSFYEKVSVDCEFKRRKENKHEMYVLFETACTGVYVVRIAEKADGQYFDRRIRSLRESIDTYRYVGARLPIDLNRCMV